MEPSNAVGISRRVARHQAAFGRHQVHVSGAAGNRIGPVGHGGGDVGNIVIHVDCFVRRERNNAQRLRWLRRASDSDRDRRRANLAAGIGHAGGDDVIADAQGFGKGWPRPDLAVEAGSPGQTGRAVAAFSIGRGAGERRSRT